MRIFFLLIFIFSLTSSINAQQKNGILLKSQLAHFNGEYFKSDSLFQNALQHISTPYSQIIGSIAYSKLLIDWDELDRADSILTRANNIFVQLDTFMNLKHQLDIQQGHLWISQKKYAEATNLFISLLDPINEVSDSIKGIIHYHLGEINLETDSLDKALEQLQLAQEWLDENYTSQINKHQAVIWNHQGRVYAEQSKFQKAKTVCQRMINLAADNQLEFHDSLMANYNYAFLQVELGQYDKAEVTLLKLKPILERLYTNKNIYYELLGQLGLIAEKTGYFEKAVNLYQQAMVFFEQAKNIEEFIFYTNNLAILFEEKLNRREEAEELYIKG